METIWAWIGLPEHLSEIRAKTLEVSAFTYSKAFPEDKRILYTNRGLLEKINTRYWTSVQILEQREWCEFHDWSRMFVMTLQDSPYIYVDSDLIIGRNAYESLVQARGLLSTGWKGMLPIGYWTGAKGWWPEFVADPRTDKELETVVKLLLDYKKYPKFLNVQGPHCTPVIFGCSPLESYVIGTETMNLMTALKEFLGSRVNIQSEQHEWVSGMFYRMVASRFHISVSQEYVVPHGHLLHIGGGGENPWLFKNEGFDTVKVREAWAELASKILRGNFYNSGVPGEEELIDYMRRKI